MAKAHKTNEQWIYAIALQKKSLAWQRNQLVTIANKSILVFDMLIVLQEQSPAQ